MTRLKKTATIIALVLCFAGAVAGELWEASHSPYPPSQSAATKNEHKADTKTVEERHQATEEAIAYYTLWLMAFTGILALATAGLGGMNFFQLRLARAEFVSGHRPRVVLKDVYIVNDEVIYMLVNVGATKATIVESWILMEFVPEGRPLRPLRSFGHNDLGSLVFEGGEMKDLTFDTPSQFSFEFRFPDSIRIGIGQAAVEGQRYFTGTIVYKDDLGTQRRTVFRRRLNLERLSFERLGPEQERDHEYSD